MSTLDLDVHLPAIAAGDSGAFARWVAGVEEPLRRELLRFATLVDVEAVLQETLLRAWQIAPRVELDGKPNSLLRVSRRIARNLAIDLARRHRGGGVDIETLLAAPREPIEPSVPDPLLRELILACKDKLPKRPRKALEARLAGAGLEPDARLARQMKMQLNTFLQNVTRARRALAECLQRSGVNWREELG